MDADDSEERVRESEGVTGKQHLLFVWARTSVFFHVTVSQGC